MQECLKKSNWLIIAHDFNMDGRAASLTITDKIPYLLQAGISIQVISAITGQKDGRFPHFQPLPWGPTGFRFDSKRWLTARYGKGLLYKTLLGLLSLIVMPMSAIGRATLGLSTQASWSLPAYWRARKLVKKNKIDVVYTTGGPWSAHYAGYLIKKKTGVTWIAEIHDPMTSTKIPKSRDEKFVEKLEQKIAENADFVWWFTENALSEAKKRHPSLKNKGFVIHPGAEPPGCFLPLPEKHTDSESVLNIMHFGSLADDRSFAPLLAALSVFFNTHPEYKNKIKIHVYGTTLDKTSKAAVDQFSMHSIMVLHGRIEQDKKTGKSGRELIMDIMRNADVLLLLHGDRDECREYIPSKLYDYSWTDRPIFALTHKSDELDQLLEKRNAYLAHTVDQASILKALENLTHDWQEKKLRKQDFNPVTPKDAVDEILKRIRFNRT